MTVISSASELARRRAWLWRNRTSFQAWPARTPARLLVDVSELIHHDARTGIQRVVRAIWSQLNQRSGSMLDVLPVFATRTQGYCYAPADFLSRGQKPNHVPVRIGEGDKFLGLDLAAHLLPRYATQVRAWRKHGATIHVIVYDLLPLIRPKWFTSTAVRNFAQWYSMLQRDVDRAICISADVACQLRRRLEQTGRDRPLVTHIPMGSDVEGSLPTIGIGRDVSEALERTRRRPAILMVGTVEPRKGYDVALRAFGGLWRNRGDEAPDLVIVGKAGWKTLDLQRAIRSHPEHGRRLHWLEGVSDEGLGRLYEACSGLLMTSHAEGFGLPLIEAAKHGQPVLARDLEVFREQDLPNVSYFENDEQQTLGEAILELATRGRQVGVHTSKLPTWADSVDELLRRLGIDYSERAIAQGLASAAKVA